MIFNTFQMYKFQLEFAFSPCFLFQFVVKMRYVLHHHD